MGSKKLLAKITDKWPVKVLSVAAALVLSVFHRLSTLESRFFSVPLRIEVSDHHLVPASFYSPVVKVSLRGEANSIFPILEDDIEAYIDLRKYINEGSYKIPVQILKKGSAVGVEPLEISVDPIEIPLDLELKVNKTISVAPVFRGTVAEGYELTGQYIIPANVLAEGPASAMESLFEANTVMIDLEGRYEDFSVMVNIVNNDPLVTIHGNRIVEYRGTIRRISRETQTVETRRPVADIYFTDEEEGVTEE